jgi:hypothetical protein
LPLESDQDRPAAVRKLIYVKDDDLLVKVRTIKSYAARLFLEKPWFFVVPP